MEHKIEAKWNGKMGFDIDIQGHKIRVDADESVGGENSGPTPKPLMLASLAGCTGMDVVSILKKMRVEYDDLSIGVKGGLNDEHPKKYNDMVIVYDFYGQNIDREKVEKAIKMSQDKYCGVYAVYKEAVYMDYELNIHE